MEQDKRIELDVIPPSKNRAGYLLLREKIAGHEGSDLVKEGLAEILANQVTVSNLPKEELIKHILGASHNDINDLKSCVVVGEDDDKKPEESKDFEFVYPTSSEANYLQRKERGNQLVNAFYDYKMDTWGLIDFLRPRVKPKSNKYKNLMTDEHKYKVIGIFNKSLSDLENSDNLERGELALDLLESVNKREPMSYSDIIERQEDIARNIKNHWHDVRLTLNGKTVKEIEEVLGERSADKKSNSDLAYRIKSEEAAIDYLWQMSHNQIFRCLVSMIVSVADKDEEGESNASAPLFRIRKK